MFGSYAGFTQMLAVVIAVSHRPFQTLTGNPHPALAAENRRLLHVHVVAIQARRTVRNQDVEVDKVFVHSFDSFELSGFFGFGVLVEEKVFQQLAFAAVVPVIQRFGGG